MKNTLHVYGQRFHHSDVVIAGTTDALLRLVNVITNAVAHGEAESHEIAPFYVNDGEGFAVRVTVIAGDLDVFAVPYTEDYAREQRENAVWP